MNNVRGADYIIVGAGSAGCALAWRLGEAGCDVLLIEHGKRDGGVLIDMPAALSYPMNMPRYDWGYHTEPEANMNGRRMACPRGKVWGGSSAINGMVYVRGHAEDYNFWQQDGADGWDYRHVLPYFMRMENAPDGQRGWRGDSGPLHVTRHPNPSPLYDAFIQAGVEAGYGHTADYNGENPEGFCRFDRTVYKGIRWSAARAYLHPALKLPNVRLVQGLARRVVFSKTRATAIEVQIGGETVVIFAGRELILSASAINSPCLLMRSGVGDAKALAALGIEVVADVPGVGQNLQDHLEVYVQQRCKQPVTLNRKLNLFAKACVGARWLFLRDGDGATNHFEAGAFVRSPEADYADTQIHFLAGAIRYDGSAPVAGDGFQAHVGPMRSQARGALRLRAATPETPPQICFNYMSGKEDWRNFRYGIRLAREVFNQPAMAAYTGAPIMPTDDSDAALDEFIRCEAESAYHPCGTCKMGAANDRRTVVDSDCRVLGIEGLRVVDSSIFPRILYGNLNAPSIMVGEKAAAHILDAKLPPDEREKGEGIYYG